MTMQELGMNGSLGFNSGSPYHNQGISDPGHSHGMGQGFGYSQAQYDELMRQQTMHQAMAQQKVAYAQQEAAKPARRSNPDERLLVLLTDE